MKDSNLGVYSAIDANGDIALIKISNLTITNMTLKSQA